MPIDLISNIQPAPGGAGLFPTHLDIYGAGGYQVQPTTAARDAIPALNRKQGMVVFVVADGNEYRLDAGLTTWSIAGGGGGGTLAGDVTGPAASNVVERLTGLAGVVSVPTAALAFGATPAAALGLIRVPHNVGIIYGRNQANSADASLLLWSTPGNTLTVGSGADQGVYNGNTTLTLIGGSQRVDLFSAGMRFAFNNVYWSSGVTAPKLMQDTQTTNVAPPTLTVATGLPFNNVATTGANNKPGDLRIDLGTNTNGWITTMPAAYIRYAGTDRMRIGVNGAGEAAFHIGTVAAAYSVINSGILMDRGITYKFTNVAVTGSVTALSIYTGDAVMLGSPSNANATMMASNANLVFTTTAAGTGWQSNSTRVMDINAINTSPIIRQTGHSTDSPPQDFTIQTQQPWNNVATTGSNNKPGDLIFDVGTATNASVLRSAVRFNSHGANRATLVYDQNGNVRWWGGPGGLAADPYLQITPAGGVAIVAGTSQSATVAAGTGGTIYLSIPAGTPKVQLSASVWTWDVPAAAFDSFQVAPVIQQNVMTTNNAPQDLTIRPQQPWNNIATTGGNNVPGSVRFDMGTPTNGASIYNSVLMRWTGTDRTTLGWDGTTSFLSLTHATLATASAGMIRLPHSDIPFLMMMRNAANTADMRIVSTNPGDLLIFGDSATGSSTYLQAGTNGVSILSGGVVRVLHQATSADHADFGAAPATIGYIRLPNAAKIAFRNAANTANLSLVYLDSSDQASFGGPPGVSAETAARTSVVATSQVCINPVAASTTALSWNFGSYYFLAGESILAPTMGQTQLTTNVAPQPLLVLPQDAFTGATGATNGKPGDLRFGMGTRRDTATAYGRFEGKLGPGTGVTQWSMRTVLEGSATNGVYLIGGDSTGTDGYLGLYRAAGWVLSSNTAGAGGTLNAGTLTFQIAASTRFSIANTNALFQGMSAVAFNNSGPFDLNFSYNVTAARIYQSAHFTDSATNALNIVAQGAYAGSSGTNLDGAPVQLMGGNRGTTAGRRTGTRIYMANSDTIMFEVSEVQAEATSPSRAISVFHNNNVPVSTARMPTGTGDLVWWIGNCATAPTVSPVGGGILYVEAGALKYRGTSGTVTTLGPA